MDCFPDEFVLSIKWISILGAISIIYPAYIALSCSNLKKLIAYSSISHMGFVVLGIASLNHEGLHGAIFQMVSHSIISASLFLSCGVIQKENPSFLVTKLKSLWHTMPYYSFFFSYSFLCKHRHASYFRLCIRTINTYRIF